MAADASIYSGLQQPRPLNPLASMLDIQQLQAAQQQNQLAQLAFADRQRAQAEQERLRGIYAGGAQGAALEQALLQGGFADQALKLGKDRRENVKLDTETQAKQLETAKQRLDIMGQAFGAVRSAPTPENAISTIQYLTQSGIFTPEQAQQYSQQIAGATPQQIAALADQAFRATLSARDQLPKYDTVNTGQQQVTNAIDPVTGQVRVINTMQNTVSPDSQLSANTSAANAALAAQTARANNSATVAATLRGQDLTDARTRETLATGSIPSGYRRGANGSLEFIPGGPADPAVAKRAAPTEFQGKSAAFGGRAQEADKIIENLTGKYSPAAVNAKQAAAQVWGVGGALEAGINSTLSDAAQKAEQAQRDFVNAVLRQESGAAIGQTEFDNAKRQYFPQPGDSQAVIQQKAQNRKLAVQGLINNAGNATVPKVPKGATGGWTVEEVK